MISLLQKVINILNQILGKGYGSFSITKEVKMATKLSGASIDYFLDVGANKGLYTEEIIKKYPEARCILFEPSETNIKILIKKFKSNRNVRIENYALSNFEGTSVLYSPDTLGSGMASLTERKLDHFGINQQIKTEVKIKMLDDVINEIVPLTSRIGLIKIDVEGHELNVLKGGLNTIKRASIIQFEFGGCNLDTKISFQEIFYFFKEINFKIYRISPLGLIPIKSYKEEDEYYQTTNFVAVKIPNAYF